MKWKTRIPLATNPVVLIDLVKAIFIVFLIMSLLFTIIFLTTGETEALLPLIGMFAIICGGLMILSWLIMLIVFGNRFSAEYILDQHGAAFITTDKRAKIANRIAMGAGLLGGSMSTLGAGMIAASNENIAVEWSWIQGYTINKSLKTIGLRNSWRNVLVLYCPDNFADVCEFVKTHVTITETRKKSPLWAMLGWTALVILASILMFMEYPSYFQVHAFAAIFVMLFAVASLWLIPFLAYAMFAGNAWVIGSLFYWGIVQNNFTYVRDSEWIPFILLLLGQAFLVWIGIRLLRGKIVSMLLGDRTGEN